MHMDQPHQKFMQAAIDLARAGMNTETGGPFGCVIVKDNQVIATGMNSVTSTNDPTAHAEVVAIRMACKVLETYQLTGCDLYTSCEPCPMCLAAALWARIDKVFFGNGSEATENVGFIDRRILEELKRPRQERTMPSEQLLADEAGLVFQEWQDAKKRNRPEFT